MAEERGCGDCAAAIAALRAEVVELRELVDQQREFVEDAVAFRKHSLTMLAAMFASLSEQRGL